MMALLGSVLVASLAGSAHCAGMCGGMSLMCSGGMRRDGGGGVHARAAVAYHLSRLAAYAGAGAVAGAVGGAVDLGASLAGVQHTAAIAAGVTVALAGVATLMKAGGFPLTRVARRSPLSPAIAGCHRAALRAGPVARSMIVGAGSVLLPCGWLWAFLVVAAGTGSALAGAASMAVFWAGTVPLLAALGVGVQRLGSAWRGRLAVVSALAMISLGLSTALTAGRRAESLAIASQSSTAPQDLLVRLEHASSEVPACCREQPPDGAASEPAGRAKETLP